MLTFTSCSYIESGNLQWISWYIKKTSFTGKNWRESEEVSVRAALTGTRWLVYSRAAHLMGFFPQAVILSCHEWEVSQQEGFQDSEASKWESSLTCLNLKLSLFANFSDRKSEPHACLMSCLTTAKVYGERGCGSGVEPLQRGSDLLHEPKEEPSDLSDVHRPVHQIPCESRCTSLLMVSRSEHTWHFVMVGPGFLCEPPGYGCAAHHIRSPGTSAGKILPKHKIRYK